MVIFYGITCTAAFLIIVAYIAFFHRKDIWFLMTFVSLLICNLGYLAQALSWSLGEALLGNRISYVGSVFLPFFLLMTIMEICKTRYPKFLPFILCIVSAAMMVVTMSGGYLDIYYKSVSFTVSDGMGVLTKEYGPLHSTFYVYLVAYFAAMLTVIIRAFFKKKIVSYKHAVALLIAVFINIVIYISEKSLHIDYEVLSVSYTITSIFLLFIYKELENYDADRILQTTLSTDNTGVILFDSGNNFKGCNDEASEVFPELNDLKLEYPVPMNRWILQKIVLPVLSKSSAVDNATYRHSDRIYRIFAKPIREKNNRHKKPIGTAVIISDDTAQQEYLELISSYNERLEEEVAQKTQHLLEMHNQLIMSMADMVEGRDPNTGGHIKRTSRVVGIFVDRLQKAGVEGYTESFLRNTTKAAPMHDLGKIAIDDAILRKPGKYTDAEYVVMQTHAAKGAEIVGRILKREDDEEFYDIAVNVAHYHHEKYDGTGYPQRLSGTSIPAEARIMALADVFDALVSKRCYKEKYSYDEAFAIIENSLGAHFDPDFGRIFLACKDELIDCYEAQK